MSQLSYLLQKMAEYERNAPAINTATFAELETYRSKIMRLINQINISIQQIEERRQNENKTPERASG